MSRFMEILRLEAYEFIIFDFEPYLLHIDIPDFVFPRSDRTDLLS